MAAKPFHPASTSAITYGVYYAPDAAGTLYLLQSSTGANYGGTLNAYIQLTEIVP